MAMGRRKREEQGALWIAASELPQSGGHPFYQQVNKILEVEGFDRFAEERCRRRCIFACCSLGTSRGSTASEGLPGGWRIRWVCGGFWDTG